MDFLKKNYEKIVLGVVLLGLAVVMAFLPFKISADKKGIEDTIASVTRHKVDALTNLDLTAQEQTLKRLATPAVFNFSDPNRLFNPMPWQKTPDGRLIAGNKVGPVAATVTNITPLYLRLTLDNTSPSDSGTKYVIGVERQAAPVAAQRVKKQTYCKKGDKNDTFLLLEVKGKPEDPTQVIVQLNDTGERAVITKEQPFKRVDGYMADVRYEPEKRAWSNRRVGSPPLVFNGEEYKIVAINQSEVVLSATSNGKKWTIKYVPSPAA